MIKSLRRKFVLIMMSVVTVILLALFLTILITTQNDMQQRNMDVLRQSLQEPRLPDFGKIGRGGLPPKLRAPVLVVQATDQELEVVTNQIYNIDQTTAEEAAQLALEQDEEAGVLREYNLRFLKRNVSGITTIAFVDTSVESSVLQSLTVTMLLIGAAALLAFFVLSVFLARWAVAPVERAWDRQRQFVADASHELKTPLTVILSNAEMLSNSSPNDQQHSRRVESIQAEGLRMKRLIENMLTLAKSDYQGTTAHLAPVCLSDIVTDSVLLYESAIYDEGKRFGYDVQPGLMVEGDPQKLRQLVDILLDNANKYTPKGGCIDLELRVVARKAQLSVSNDGEPIPKEELEKIFRRFYRIDQSRQSHGGFGLGLSIAQSITQEHRGKIWAESKDHSNVFNVQLPLSGS